MGNRKISIYSCDKILSDRLLHIVGATEDLSYFNNDLTISCYIRDDMIKDVNGTKIVQIYKKETVDNSYGLFGNEIEIQ